MLIWATRGLKSGESSKNKLKLSRWSFKYCIDDVNCNQGLPGALSIYLQHLFTAESRFTLITCDRCESAWRHWGERYPACYILQRLAAGPFGFRMRSSEPLWNHMLVQRALGSSWCITTLSLMWLERLYSSWTVLLMLLNRKITEVGSRTLIFHRDDSEPSHQIVNDLIFPLIVYFVAYFIRDVFALILSSVRKLSSPSFLCQMVTSCVCVRTLFPNLLFYMCLMCLLWLWQFVWLLFGFALTACTDFCVLTSGIN